MSGQSAHQSRLTFRETADNVAWQKQLRDKYLAEGVPPVPHLDIKKAVVRRVSRSLAEQVILKYEWLGTMAPGCNYFYGMFYGAYCAGVTCISIPYLGANTNAHLEFAIDKYELAYLARGANVHWAPKGSNSKLVGWTCKLLAKDTNAKLIIAYSDTDAGEIGTIYQACNWVCVGKGSTTRQIIAPNGRVYDQKYISNNALKQRVSWSKMHEALLSAGWTEQASNPKYRYVYVLDKEDKALVDRVEHMRKPYPKRNRADEATEDAASDQLEKGSANLTRPLITVTGQTPTHIEVT